MNKLSGPVIKVTNIKSKYYNDLAIIENETSSKYLVLSLSKLPIRERFMYGPNNVVFGMKYAHKSYYINKNDVVHLNYNKTVHIGSGATGKLLRENIGLTKNQIELKY